MLLSVHLSMLGINAFPPEDAFWCNSSRRLTKKLWPNVKLLIMSNFSFGHNVFNFFQQLSYLLWTFFRFCHYVFKVVCCRFIVCGKELKFYYLSFISFWIGLLCCFFQAIKSPELSTIIWSGDQIKTSNYSLWTNATW